MLKNHDHLAPLQSTHILRSAISPKLSHGEPLLSAYRNGHALNFLACQLHADLYLHTK